MTRHARREINLWNVYFKMEPYDPIEVLWELMKERTADQSISHKRLPTIEQHVAFVLSHPYHEWYLVHTRSNGVVGSVYLTNHREIGVFIFNRYQAAGFGTAAIVEIMKRYPGERLLANINPANTASIKTFEKLGARHIQNTYELPSVCEKE